jgi:hypothetical protein
MKSKASTLDLLGRRGAPPILWAARPSPDSMARVVEAICGLPWRDSKRALGADHVLVPNGCLSDGINGIECFASPSLG